MFQNNPLLAQLKQTLHEKTPRVEGLVRRNNKGFGFLESDNKKSYFIPPQWMKKVMNGDRISAVLQTNNDKEFVEPETLLQAYLTRFVAKIIIKEGKSFIVPNHPLINDLIPFKSQVSRDFQQDDWVVAELTRHPLEKSGGFFATVTEFITDVNDHFAPWLVTLSRNGLEKNPPEECESYQLQDDGMIRQDYTHLPFFTIDSESTEDMDDALYLEAHENGHFTLMVAIADPTAYIAENSELDQIAKTRSFTNYLPGFNIPMLPRQLSDELCSLKQDQKRPALLCKMTITPEGDIAENAEFSGGWIQSHARLSYDKVSDYFENKGTWQPENDIIKSQLTLLNTVADLRTQWRNKTSLVFKERPDYRFVLGENGKVLDIVMENRRVANRMIEESMLAANIVLPRLFIQHNACGIFNTHTGFDPSSTKQAVALLEEHNLTHSEEDLLTLSGYCQLRRQIDALPTRYIDTRLRRHQSPAEMSLTVGPHFGLGLPAYATWTSPIRKYSDMINHRLIKAILQNQALHCPDENTLLQLTERRKANRFAERNIADWLYAEFYQDKIGLKGEAEIVDINRGGMRVQLLESGAFAFIPSSFIHPAKEELDCQQELGLIFINQELKYRQGDNILIEIKEVRLENQSIIVAPCLKNEPEAPQDAN